jgi:peptidylprolyl isomerase
VIAIVIGNGGDDDGGGSETASFEKPTVEVPEGAPPTELVTEDITEGEGAEAKAGDQLSLQYVGVDFETGEEFDSSYTSGQPIQVDLGAGGVIPGWDQGIVGMKAGGERKLVIPPDLAYGAQGSGDSIGPNATLVFVVQLESIN